MFDCSSKISSASLLLGLSTLTSSCANESSTQSLESLTTPAKVSASPEPGSEHTKFVIQNRLGGVVEIDTKQSHRPYNLRFHQTDELVIRASYEVTEADAHSMAAGVGYVPVLLDAKTATPFVVTPSPIAGEGGARSYSSPVFAPGDVIEIEAWLPPQTKDGEVRVALLLDNVRDHEYSVQDNERYIYLNSVVIRK